jgi:hypothetical protein
MTAMEFRRLALGLPETSEHAHMGHPDFRVGGKIFATLGYPDSGFGMVILPLDQQQEFLRNHPEVFAPAKGAWGRSGSTIVSLKDCDAEVLQRAIEVAWRKRAPVQ